MTQQFLYKPVKYFYQMRNQKYTMSLLFVSILVPSKINFSV